MLRLTMAAVRLLDRRDIGRYLAHSRRHRAESGRGGDVVFTPVSEDPPWTDEDVRDNLERRWAKAPEELGWGRCWGTFVEDRLVGHLSLTGGNIEAETHRATLAMGVERRHRGQGIGRALLGEGLAFAEGCEVLAWVDLGVFAGNPGARRLYEAFGFEAWGTHRDRFRVLGESVDDVQMVRGVG